MATLPQTAKLTEEEYLRLERAAETKSEFHDGEMFAMAGGSANHSLLASKAGSILDRQVPAGCRVFNADLRIRIKATGSFVYPDCSVVCGDPQLLGDRGDILLNPLLVVEVLSPSTENYDRGKKFELYRTIESLREYLLIHQDRPYIEHYSKQDDGSWVLRDMEGAQAVVPVPRLQLQIQLAELYATQVK